MEETFAIVLKNHKERSVEIRVLEHLYRGRNWEITHHSNLFMKLDSRTIEFRVTVQPEEPKTITYTVRYSR